MSSNFQGVCFVSILDGQHVSINLDDPVLSSNTPPLDFVVSLPWSAAGMLTVKPLYGELFGSAIGILQTVMHEMLADTKGAPNKSIYTFFFRFNRNIKVNLIRKTQMKRHFSPVYMASNT